MCAADAVFEPGPIAFQCVDVMDAFDILAAPVVDVPMPERRFTKSCIAGEFVRRHDAAALHVRVDDRFNGSALHVGNGTGAQVSPAFGYVGIDETMVGGRRKGKKKEQS